MSNNNKNNKGEYNNSKCQLTSTKDIINIKKYVEKAFNIDEWAR